jgi:putative copper export protein
MVVMDTLFVALLVLHVTAAAVWVGGNTVIEFVFQRKLNVINSSQAGLVSKNAENAFTYMAWGALATMSATGLMMIAMSEIGILPYNLGRLFTIDPSAGTVGYSGPFLLASMLLTLVALVNASLLTWYFPPRLKLQKYSEDPIFRNRVLVSMQIQNRIAVVIVILMAIYTTLVEAPALMHVLMGVFI